MCAKSVQILPMCVLLIFATVVNANLKLEDSKDDPQNNVADRDVDMQSVSEYILPRLLIAELSPELPEKQSFKSKRIAGLDNLDVMTKLLTRLPMKTKTDFDTLRNLMLKNGRRRK